MDRNEAMTLELTLDDVLDLVAAIELSPLDHEVVLAKLLRVLYRSGETTNAA